MLWTTSEACDGTKSIGCRAGIANGAAEVRRAQINYGRAELRQPEHESEFLTSGWHLGRNCAASGALDD
jgi:hypothetical protein